MIVREWQQREEYISHIGCYVADHGVEALARVVQGEVVYATVGYPKKGEECGYCCTHASQDMRRYVLLVLKNFSLNRLGEFLQEIQEAKDGFHLVTFSYSTAKLCVLVEVLQGGTGMALSKFENVAWYSV